MKETTLILILCLFQVSIFCKDKEFNSMKTFAQIINKEVQLEDSIFQKSTDEVTNVIYDILDNLSEEKKSFGIGLKAPEIITEEEYNTKKIYCIAFFSGLRQWECFFKRNKLILFINNHSGAIKIIPFYNNTKQLNFNKMMTKQTKPDEEGASVFQTVCEGYSLDMLFPSEFLEGTFTAYALYYDWVSEPVCFQVMKNSIKNNQPIILNLSDAGQASAVITHSAKKQSQKDEEYAIEISEIIGVQSDSLPIKISFTVNLKKEWLSFQWEKDKKPAPKALIPVSVFVTKHNQDQKKPVSWHWTVPVYSSQKVNEGDQAEGFLITDLFHEEHNIRVEREFLAWCVVGTHLFGPEKFVLKK